MKKSPLNDQIRLHHMLEFAQKVQHHTSKMTRDTLDADELALMGIIRLIEMIGEAASKISPEIQKQHSQIDWAGIIGMRNRVIHGYFDIDLDIIWDTIQHNIPPLINQLTNILS